MVFGLLCSHTHYTVYPLYSHCIPFICGHYVAIIHPWYGYPIAITYPLIATNSYYSIASRCFQQTNPRHAHHSSNVHLHPYGRMGSGRWSGSGSIGPRRNPERAGAPPNKKHIRWHTLSMGGKNGEIPRKVVVNSGSLLHSHCELISKKNPSFLVDLPIRPNKKINSKKHQTQTQQS